ncbi:MAG: hypothetical protein JXA10_03845 [Anaerolineae bacterium]|nr:hypothetical protein [Anaerolineae bacterium]
MTHSSHTLFLLDVDGVLVHPVGYKNAMRATVDHFTARMGQAAMGPDNDEIAIFEACGLTNEWDSCAMCLSQLMLAALDQHPDLYRASLDEMVTAIQAANLALPRPNFVAAARRIHTSQADGHFPAARYLKLIVDEIDPAHQPLFTTLLGNVYDVFGTPTTRVFQTYTLGSVRFADTYDQAAPFESESMLATQDVALLDADHRDRLLAWDRELQHGVTIYTARPSLPPTDLPEPIPTAPMAGQTTGYAPEAELAVDLLGVTGQIPLIGQGRVSWLAGQHGRGPGDYIKPSPVQALAGIGAAFSGTETDSLQAAAALVERGELIGPLAALRDHASADPTTTGQAVRVVVFEDSTGGIRATRAAVAHLTQMGIPAQCVAVGVSPHADKRAALQEVADHVVDDINAGLDLIWDRT